MGGGVQMCVFSCIQFRIGIDESSRTVPGNRPAHARCGGKCCFVAHIYGRGSYTPKLSSLFNWPVEAFHVVVQDEKLVRHCFAEPRGRTNYRSSSYKTKPKTTTSRASRICEFGTRRPDRRESQRKSCDPTAYCNKRSACAMHASTRWRKQVSAKVMFPARRRCYCTITNSSNLRSLMRRTPIARDCSSKRSPIMSKALAHQSMMHDLMCSIFEHHM